MNPLYTTNDQTTGQPEPTAFSFPSGFITPRETEVLVLMAQGFLNKEIAVRLNISADTVKMHLKNIYKKTGACNKIEALNRTRWLNASPLATNTSC